MSESSSSFAQPTTTTTTSQQANARQSPAVGGGGGGYPPPNYQQQQQVQYGSHQPYPVYYYQQPVQNNSGYQPPPEHQQQQQQQIYAVSGPPPPPSHGQQSGVNHSNNNMKHAPNMYPGPTPPHSQFAQQQAPPYAISNGGGGNSAENSNSSSMDYQQQQQQPSSHAVQQPPQHEVINNNNNNVAVQQKQQQDSQLRAQLSSYRHLARNDPLPPRQMMEMTAGGMPTRSTLVNGHEYPPDAAAAAAYYAGQQQQQPGVHANAVENHHHQYSNGVVARENHHHHAGANATNHVLENAEWKQMYSPAGLLKLFNERQQRRNAVLIKPVGIDPVAFYQEREAAIENRVCLRIKELEDLMPAMVANDDQCRQKLLTELYSLRLINMQRQLRNEVINAIRPNANLHTAPYLHLYYRPKRITLADARLTERIEQQRRAELEAVKRSKHLQFLDAIIKRQTEMRDYQLRVRSARQRINRAVITWHANEEVRQKREAERQERERMRLLREEDEEGYRKLVDEKKHKRLAYLLKQTDEFVETLALSVHEHKTTSRRHRDKAPGAQQQQQSNAAAAPAAIVDENSQDSSASGPAVAALPAAAAITTTVSAVAATDNADKITAKAVVAEEEAVAVIRLVETATGKVLGGQDVPAAGAALDQWLEEHPGWEVVKLDESTIDAAAAAATKQLEISASSKKISSSAALAASAKNINSNNVPEDEYVPLQAGSANYYQLAHTTKEEVKEQPQMMRGGQLKEYQVAGLEWLVSLYNNNLNGILADEMGLGKTIQTIALISYLIETKGVRGPYLIIVPLSTLSNWMLEFDRWSPSVEKIAYKGTKPVRAGLQREVRKNRFQVLITTYEYVIKDKGPLSKIHWRYMIIDEGHRMKNHHCKLTITLNQCYKAPQRLLLTGTPLQNKLPELWALLNFILPAIFKSCANFEQWFNAPFQTTGEKVELNEEESMLIIRRLHKVLRPFLLRRLKKEVESQLPEKSEHILKVDMSALQRVMYSEMQRRGVLIHEAQQNGKASRKATALQNTLMQLRKICNHPFMFDSVEKSYARCRGYEDEIVGGRDLYRAAGKFELLERILPKLFATGHKVLIFCQMTTLMTILEDYFNWKNYKYMRLDGTTKADDRGAMLKKFSDPEENYFIFVLSTRAGGLGLNLQTADTVIIFDSDWNPHQDLQAQDRAHRIGQKNEVRVLRLITAHSIEEKILACAQYKLGMDKKIIQAGMFNQRSTHNERERFLADILQERVEVKSTKGKSSTTTTKRQTGTGTGTGGGLNRSISSSSMLTSKQTLKETAAAGAPSAGTNPEDNDSSLMAPGRDDSNADADDTLNDETCAAGSGDEDDDDEEFPDAETLNEILARGDDEYNLFMRMDMEAKKAEMLQPGGPVSQLIDEKELPEYLLRVVDNLDGSAAAAGAAAGADGSGAGGNGGRRARKAGISYADELSEADFLRACEEGNYDELGMFTQRGGRGGGDRDDGGDSDEDSNASPKKRKRGRPSRASQANAAGGGRSDSAAGVAGAAVTTPPAALEQMQMLLDKLLKFEDEEGRILSHPFKRLPTKADLPDYYEVIQKPMDFRRIQLRLKHADYVDMKDFMSEIELMFGNAQTYNREDSQIYIDAVAFMNYIPVAQEQVAKEYAELAETRAIAAAAKKVADDEQKAKAKSEDVDDDSNRVDADEKQNDSESEAEPQQADGDDKNNKNPRRRSKGGFFGGGINPRRGSNNERAAAANHDSSSSSDEEFRPAARRMRGGGAQRNSQSSGRGAGGGGDADEGGDGHSQQQQASQQSSTSSRRGRQGRPPGRARGGTTRGGRGSRGGRGGGVGALRSSSAADDAAATAADDIDNVVDADSRSNSNEQQKSSQNADGDKPATNERKREPFAGNAAGETSPVSSLTDPLDTEDGKKSSKKEKLDENRGGNFDDSADVDETNKNVVKSNRKPRGARGSRTVRGGGRAAAAAAAAAAARKRRISAAGLFSSSDNEDDEEATEEVKKDAGDGENASVSPTEVETTSAELNTKKSKKSTEEKKPASKRKPTAENKRQRASKAAAVKTASLQQPTHSDNAMHGTEDEDDEDHDEEKADGGSTSATLAITSPEQVSGSGGTFDSMNADRQQPPPRSVSRNESQQTPVQLEMNSPQTAQILPAMLINIAGAAAASLMQSSLQSPPPAPAVVASTAITGDIISNAAALLNAAAFQQQFLAGGDADQPALASIMLSTLLNQSPLPLPQSSVTAAAAAPIPESALSPRAALSPLSPDATIRRSSEYAIRMDAASSPNDGAAVVRCAPLPPPPSAQEFVGDSAAMLLGFAGNQHQHEVISEVVVTTTASTTMTTTTVAADVEAAGNSNISSTDADDITADKSAAEQT